MAYKIKRKKEKRKWGIFRNVYEANELDKRLNEIEAEEDRRKK